MKKKSFVFISVVLALCFIANSLQADDLLKHLSFKVSLGFRSLALKDLGDLGKNLDPYITQVPLDSGYTQDGEYKDFSLGPEYAAEILITPAKNFDIAFGTGFIRRENSSLLYLTKEDVTIDALFVPKITVIPITISFYYHLPVVSDLETDIYFYAGVDYSFAKAEGRVRSESLHLETTLNAESSGLGLQGGMGYEFPIVSPISLFVELGVEYCELKKWTGEWKHIELDSGAQLSSKGTVYKFEEKYGDKWYPTVRAWPSEPDGNDIRKVRDFEASLSGVACRIGIRTRL